MRPKFSDLKFIDYILNETKFFSVVNENDDFETIRNKIQQRKFDIDFDIFINEENNDIFKIILKIDNFSKNKQKIFGYNFLIEITASFYLKNLQKLPTKKQTQYILFSALPMTISLARAELGHITANAVLGRYILPAIDINDLIDKWSDKNK
jgi:preprotein translocase subunit SecB